MVIYDHETMLNNDEFEEIYNLYLFNIADMNKKKISEWFMELLKTRSEATIYYTMMLFMLINPFISASGKNWETLGIEREKFFLACKIWNSQVIQETFRQSDLTEFWRL